MTVSEQSDFDGKVKSYKFKAHKFRGIQRNVDFYQAIKDGN